MPNFKTINNGSFAGDSAVSVQNIYDAWVQSNINMVWFASIINLYSFTATVNAGAIDLSLVDIEGNTISSTNPVYGSCPNNTNPNRPTQTTLTAPLTITVPSTYTLGASQNQNPNLIYVYLVRENGGTFRLGYSGAGLGVCPTRVSYTTQQSGVFADSINTLYTSAVSATATIVPIGVVVAVRGATTWTSITSVRKFYSTPTIPYISHIPSSGINLTTNTAGFNHTITHNLNDPYVQVFPKVFLLSGVAAGYVADTSLDYHCMLGYSGGTQETNIYIQDSNSIIFRQSTTADTQALAGINGSYVVSSTSLTPSDFRVYFVIVPSTGGY